MHIILEGFRSPEVVHSNILGSREGNTVLEFEQTIKQPRIRNLEIKSPILTTVLIIGTKRPHNETPIGLFLLVLLFTTS